MGNLEVELNQARETLRNAAWLGTNEDRERIERAVELLCGEPCKELPSAQPEPSEITDEQAILHLQSTGWMQNHDREMYESGLREKLADDIGSYDSLIPCEDAISRKEALYLIGDYDLSMGQVVKGIHALPPVTPKQRTGWIPFTYRPATDEEKKDFAKRTGYDEEDIDTILNCQLPEDGETVLITDRLGNVEVDTFINDGDGCYFECNCDMEDVRAWMPLPKPYDPQESEAQE